MWQKILTFRKKLSFFQSLFKNSKVLRNHFPELTKIINERKDDTAEAFERYEKVLDLLIMEYNERFQDFQKHEIYLQLAFQPHILDFNNAPEEFQMELIELSKDEIVISQFNNKEDPVKIWKRAIEYPRLRELARQMISCFSSTYLCEATFSDMKQIKNVLRIRMTDAHLGSQLKLKTSSIKPNIPMLIQQKQSQEVIKC